MQTGKSWRDAARLDEIRVSLLIGGALMGLSSGLVRAQAESVDGAERCSESVHGRVVDERNRTPIRGAAVRTGGETVMGTDESGEFLLEAICPGRIQIDIEAVDYEVGRRIVVVPSSESTIVELRSTGREWVDLQEPIENSASEVIEIIGVERTPTNMRSTTAIRGDELERTRGKNLSEVLADVPGVSELRAGNGAAKPIVRGHFGRRLPLFIGSVRHRAQDWGLDHAPEIDPFLADELEIVRGASGVLYGPGAIGGAIVAKPPELSQQSGIHGEGHLMSFLARGAGLALRIQGTPVRLPGVSFRLEGSGKRLASPSTPDYALQNTGSYDWNAGASVGYRVGAAEYEFSYRRYQAELGVCACFRNQSSEEFFAQLERDRPSQAELFASNLTIDRPYQGVAHDRAQARARWSSPVFGDVDLIYSLQFDHRSEFDVVRDAMGPQFDFRLTTHDLNVSIEHKVIPIGPRHSITGKLGAVALAHVQSYQGLPLVPDYLAAGAGLFAVERLVSSNYELEAGVRYDILSRTASLLPNEFQRLVRSDQLDATACGGAVGEAVDCASLFHTMSASLGGLRSFSESWSLKFDLSLASRPPDPDEQYLNGTSPTLPVLGLGKPDLGPETTYSASLTSVYKDDKLVVDASVYANHISDYIYFAPAIDEMGEAIFDVLIRGSFPRFVTKPVDAFFYGADVGLTYVPKPPWEFTAQVTGVRARNRADGSHLVLIPSDRVRVAAKYTHEATSGPEQIYASVAGVLVDRQRRFDATSELAPPPDGYFLLSAELGGETEIGDRPVTVSLQGTNLLNTRYRDYTSIIRYFSDQPGVNAMFRLSFRF